MSNVAISLSSLSNSAHYQNEVAEPSWRAWFDGAAAPNPGKIGIGAVVISPQGKRLEISQLTNRLGCNNEAELLALCAVLELALAEGAKRIVVTGDSDVAVKYVNGDDRSEVARLVPDIARAQNLLSRFEQAALVWVPRHRNVDADRLSRQALGLSVDQPGMHKRKRRR